MIYKDVNLRLVEPHIYSIYPSGEDLSSYDKTFGTIYDLVGCNRLYNRLVWGYWTSEYHSLCFDALRSSPDGWVLDVGCGSLAFTAKTYANYSDRPVVLLDKSIQPILPIYPYSITSYLHYSFTRLSNYLLILYC